MGGEENLLQYVTCATTNVCAPIDTITADPGKIQKHIPSDNEHEEQQTTIQQHLTQELEGTQQPAR